MEKQARREISTEELTNIWTEKAPLLAGRSEPPVAFVGTTIVAGDGYTSSGTGDNERYNTAANSWKSLASDPSPRDATCRDP